MCEASALRPARNLTAAGAVAATALASLTLLLALAGRAVALTPLAAAPTMIDGPSSDISALSGFSVARDGTGALVYLKAVDGTPHVFVSRLLNGVFTAPVQADVGLPGASSQPVVAAGNGGVVLIGFVNGGELFVVDRAGAQSAATAPIRLAGGGITNPSISISNFGKAYMSFTAPGDGGHDIRVAAYAFGIWAVESTPMDANPSDDAGAGTARSQVATAGDGVAVVAWGEAGHVYTRRIRGTAPSVVFEQADVPSVGGSAEVSADLPSVGTGGDSSYAAVAFREVVASGVQHQSRVLMRRLHGSVMETLTAADGLSTPGTTNATNPATVATEFGRGYVTAVRDDNKVWVMSLNGNDAPGPTSQLDSLNDFSQPIAVPALAGLFSKYVAWQQDPGPLGLPEIRMRYADASRVLGGELVLSEPDLGATDAARGLVAAGDVTGNAAVAWIQGSGADTRIMVAQLYVPPGSLATNTKFQYARTSQPSLGWSAARDQWGPVRYTLYVDGRPLSPVTGTAQRPPLPLADGPHSWEVVATNPVGQQSISQTSTVWVDVVRPAAKLSLGGRKRVGSELHASVTYTDAPPPGRANQASGIADVFIDWGDKHHFHITHGKYHAYSRAGRYTLRIVVTDRAGNSTTIKQTIKVAPKPKPKPKPKKKKKPTKKKTTRQHGSRR